MFPSNGVRDAGDAARCCTPGHAIGQDEGFKVPDGMPAMLPTPSLRSAARPPFRMATRAAVLTGVVLLGACAGMRADPPAGPSRTADAGGPASPETWTRLLPDLLPAVQRCVRDAAPGTVSVVTRAWPMNHGMAGVRLRDAQGRETDCTVDTAGSRPATLRWVPTGSVPLPGADGPRFHPGMDPPPGAAGRLERVPDGQGGTAGFLEHLN